MEKPINACVLLVEDYPVNQELTKAMLEMIGCEVDIANNGKEALLIIQKKKYDLVFMDLLMPVMDGFDCTREIRKLDSPTKDIPIVALTANALHGDREKCLSAGMNDYITKPFRIVDLERMLQKLLK